MYFRIRHSTDASIIGNCNSQTIKAEYPIAFDASRLATNFLFKKAENPDLVETQKPILVQKAKLTDLIGGSSIGNSIQLIISDKLKGLLSSENHSGLQFFNLEIIFKGNKLDGYWLTNPFRFDFECVNFPQCNFLLLDINDFRYKKQLFLSDLNTFFDVISGTNIPRYLQIDNLFIRDCKKDLIILRYVRGGVGYYVSEKLKDKIESAGCTGIDFEPI